MTDSEHPMDERAERDFERLIGRLLAQGKCPACGGCGYMVHNMERRLCVLCKGTGKP